MSLKKEFFMFESLTDSVCHLFTRQPPDPQQQAIRTVKNLTEQTGRKWHATTLSRTLVFKGDREKSTNPKNETRRIIQVLVEGMSADKIESLQASLATLGFTCALRNSKDLGGQTLYLEGDKQIEDFRKTFGVGRQSPWARTKNAETPQLKM